ncbi:MAG TPA: extracellular solute-binding protein [Acetobacteraceae bacterium]|jgi:raffinose/stachyose/melibiose transport system substrate-binding protein|nr:extracellular solute-binding protein [Acetobacteraceae bacterium]
MRGNPERPAAARIGRRGLLAAAGVGVLAVSAVRSRAFAADTTIRWLHLEINPKILKIWNDAAAEYMSSHPGMQVKLQFLENEAFKAKLPTLLQSPDAPSMFYSWGGGVMRAQADTGALRPIGAQMDKAWQSRLNPAALEAFRYADKIWGAPHQMAVMDIYYNKSMFQKAGVDGEKIKTWDDLLDAVTKLKAAGITPIAVGGGDKWPIMHWWAYLVVRAGGKDALAKATAGKGGGFVSAAFIDAGRSMKQLADLKPFQEGYLAATFPSMLGQFGDGRAAMVLSFSGTYQRQAAAAADGKGLAHDNVGLFAFPAVKGGKGQPTDTMGGINGWLVSRNAPPQTTDFLNLVTDVKYQTQTAATGIYLPAVPAANDAIADPLLKQAADELARSTYHQNYFDQDLGPDVGRVVNDQTTALVGGTATPEQVAKQIQEAWDLNR